MKHFLLVCIRYNKVSLFFLSLNFFITHLGSFALLQDGKNEKRQEVQIGVIDINDSPPYFVRARQNIIPEGYTPVRTFMP